MHRELHSIYIYDICNDICYQITLATTTARPYNRGGGYTGPKTTINIIYSPEKSRKLSNLVITGIQYLYDDHKVQPENGIHNKYKQYNTAAQLFY